MARKPKEASGLRRNGLPQLNYDNNILTELYVQKTIVELQ